MAATIFVDGASCPVVCCTLVDAITAANNDAPAGDCEAGSGADEILFFSPQTLTTVNNNTYGPNGLPVITSEITISGNILNSTIARDTNAPEFRILAVGATGNLTLFGTAVSGGVARGFEGGRWHLQPRRHGLDLSEHRLR